MNSSETSNYFKFSYVFYGVENKRLPLSFSEPFSNWLAPSFWPSSRDLGLKLENDFYVFIVF